jgi:uncharacterized membrane protein
MTPLVREAAWLSALPDPLEWYLRPPPNRGTFTIFPWAGFLTAGALVGQLLDASREEARSWRLHVGLLLGAVAGIVGGYAASFLPSMYASAQFWTTSPTFFFIRLGIVVAMIPLAWLVGLTWAPLVTLGRASLFVYWIHVEMVYGSLALPLKRNLPWEGAVIATLALCVLLHAMVRLKNQWMVSRQIPASLRILTPILK